MHKRLLSAVTASVALTGLLVVAAAPAQAITGGTEDTASAAKFPNVGLLAFYDPDGRFRCSGTLVTPTVVLTAAHCTKGTLGKTIVSFDAVIDRAAPSNLPRATDDVGTGTSTEGYQTPSKFTDVANNLTFYTGTASSHPRYSDFTDTDNWNDVAVIVLEVPVEGIAPAKLAPRNYLQQFAQPRLNQTSFTLVGYGTEVRRATSGPQRPTPMSYPIVRRYTDEIGQKLTPQILQVNGNEHDTRAGGGTCFGDSGGPSFKNGYVTTVTSYAYTSNCRYLGGLQRVDIPVVQEWLATKGVTPAA